MACDYRFTAKAEKDLDGIFHYIAKELDNQTAASALLKELENLIANIRVFPKCGSLMDNEFLPARDIRKLPISNYMLYYRFEEKNECIVILRIIYGKRDPQQIIKELN